MISNIIQTLYICDQQIFSVKGQTVSSLGFAVHLFVAESSHRWYIDKMSMAEFQ